MGRKESNQTNKTNISYGNVLVIGLASPRSWVSGKRWDINLLRKSIADWLRC